MCDLMCRYVFHGAGARLNTDNPLPGRDFSPYCNELNEGMDEQKNVQKDAQMRFSIDLRTNKR